MLGLGNMLNIGGTSLMGYWAGKKGYEREREIGETSSEKADPWAKQRKYYMDILAKMYGMPSGYGESPKEDSRGGNILENLLYDMMGGKPEDGEVPRPGRDKV